MLSDSTRTEVVLCRCCDGRFGVVFDVASWRSPEWKTYRYGECADCRSLTLIDDVDPTPFYGHYSLHRPRPEAVPSRVRRCLGAVAERYLLPNTVLARTVPGLFGRPEWLSWVAGSGLDRRAGILDVGAGSGVLLGELSRWGFSDLAGIDTFVPKNLCIGWGIFVRAMALEDVERDDYGMVIFHHSLEHMDNPVEMLQLARKRLSGEGRVVVAVPVAQGPVWEQYRDNWTALDAPLHRFVPTVEGLRRLAERAGLQLGRQYAMSPAHHLIGSELIARGARPVDAPLSVLSARELQHLVGRAKALRTADECPQLSVVLKPLASR